MTELKIGDKVSWDEISEWMRIGSIEQAKFIDAHFERYFARLKERSSKRESDK